MHDYTTVNRMNWDERAPAHATSPDYGVARFVEDPSFISDVVRFDVPLLGDVRGMRAVHLQCHIGTDTVSLARLGAAMCGVDFSGAALDQARRLSKNAGVPVEFIESDLYGAPRALKDRSFDLVYTGIGALCWLPDIAGWAQVVEQLLAPGGRLFIREGHPALWTLADARPDGLIAIEYPYFERVEPSVFIDDGSYAQTDQTFVHTTTYEWNHGLGEIVTAVLDVGLTIVGLVEHDSVPWEALRGQMQRLDNGEYRLADRPWRLPHSYTLQATKPPLRA